MTVHSLADAMPGFKAAGLKAGINGPAVVHRMMLEKTEQKIIGTDPFHPACLLKLEMAGPSAKPEKYRMTEDFRTGELAVRWSDEQGDWERKLFASRPANAVMMAVDGPKGKVGFSLSMDITHNLVNPEIAAEGEYLSAHVVYVKGKGGYDLLIRVVADGGKTEAKDERITVAGADRVPDHLQYR